MGIGKEADYMLNELRKRQVQIYSDACDEGINVSGFKDPVCSEIQAILTDDFLTGAFTKYRETNEYGASWEYSVTFYIGWESAGHDKTSATEWCIRYVHDRNRRKKYVSVQCCAVIVDNSKL